MENRWFIGLSQNSAVTFSVERLGSAVLRVRDEFWEHDCLDIDVAAQTATERDQGTSASDDPAEWQSQSLPLRRSGDAWQIRVDDEDYSRWIREAEAYVDHMAEFGRRFPLHGPFVEGLGTQVLNALRSLSPGWIEVAPEIGALINRAVLEH